MLGDRRGSVVIIFALSAMVLAVVTAIVANQISFYMGKRRLQAAVDVVALVMMNSGNVDAGHAKALVLDQIGAEPNLLVTVTRGRYTPNAGTAASARFVANGTPYNAIQLDAAIPADKLMMAGMLPASLTIKASSRVARRQTASISLGSRLVRVEGGLSAALLDSTLGYNGKLTVMDYNSLASANVDVGKFIPALNTKAHLNAVTFDDVLNSNVKIGDVASVLAATTDNSVVASLLAKASPASNAQSFKLSSVVQLGSIGGLPLDALTSGQALPISVGELLAGSAALADSDHQIALNLKAVLGDASIANASLDVGQKPQILQYDTFAEKGSSVATTQFTLSVGALGTPPASLLAVTVDLASAKATIDSINCHADGTADVTIKANTSAAAVGVKPLILPKISVKAGSDEQISVNFTPADIAAQTYKPVHSTLALQTGLLGLTTQILLKPVDDLLTELGLHVAEADVKVMAASCGSPGLVY
jgi:uncharacterized membrane protein